MTQRGLVSVAVLLGVAGLHASAEELGIGDTAPKLTVKEFVKGEPVKTFEKGKIYVVEFWATWCGPCKAVIPHLTELQKKYKNVVFISVSVWERDPDKVKPFVEEMGDKMDYRVATDSVPKGEKADLGSMSKNWLTAANVEGIPHAFIINVDGKIAWMGHPVKLDKPLEDIQAGQWDIKAVKDKFTTAKKELARRKAEATKVREEKMQLLIDQLPEEEKIIVVKSVKEWGGRVQMDKDLKSIIGINFRSKPITDANLKDIKRVKGLQNLLLIDTKVTDDGLKELKDWKELQLLFLHETAITDEGLKELKGLEGLRMLGLVGTKVTDAGLKELKGLKNLRYVYLHETKVTKAGRDDLQKALPDLKIVP
jgi:thiol-disulfide isomerase/thioredoxin